MNQTWFNLVPATWAWQDQVGSNCINPMQRFKGIHLYSVNQFISFTYMIICIITFTYIILYVYIYICKSNTKEIHTLYIYIYIFAMDVHLHSVNEIQAVCWIYAALKGSVMLPTPGRVRHLLTWFLQWCLGSFTAVYGVFFWTHNFCWAFS